MANYSVDPKDPLPRYYQVYSSLLERICAGEFGPGDALPSERKLGQDYGVSRITIIKAMDLLEGEGLIEQQQGRGSFVVDQTVSKHNEMRPRIAFCMPTYTDTYITSVLIGAACAAMHRGIQLEIIGIEDKAQESAQIRRSINSGVDGVLLFPRSHYPDKMLFQELRERRYPMILLDRYYRDQDTDWVAFDDEQAGYAMTKSLINRGHRKIAIFLGDEVQISSVHARLQGYQRALEEVGLTYDEDLVCINVYKELSPASLHRLPSSHLQLSQQLRDGQFTAMIAINQIVAMQIDFDLMRLKTELLQAMVNNGTCSEISSFDVEVAAICNKLLTYNEAKLVALAIQSGELLGEYGMELLIRRLKEGSNSPSQQIKIPMEFVTFEESTSGAGHSM